jgi:hypothetical protein
MKTFVIDAMMFILLYFGIYEGQIWAMNILTFLVPISGIVGTLLLLAAVVPMKPADRAKFHTARVSWWGYYDFATDAIFMLVLAACGHAFLASCVAVYYFGKRSLDYSIKKAKEELTGE